ncbi:MAG: sodium:solute symporter family protein [Armatimonadetes bacterium]|nr:sodium:solute symporter family protein [Armatimonadota bacterium]
MKFSTFDTVVVVAYLLGIGTLGIYQARKIAGSGDYFAGGRKFNKFLMMMHALGTGTHADDPVGVSGAVYQTGLAGIWYTFVFLFVTPFYWLIAGMFRRLRFLTTSDLFEARFGSGLGLLYAIMGVLTFILNMGTMLKGTGQITAAATQGAVPDWLAVLLMTVIFVLYGTAGGLVATVVTESVQGLLIVVMSILLVPFGLMKIGGFAGLHQAVDPSKFNLAALTEGSIPWIIAGAIAGLIGIVAQPQTMEVCSTGKTEWEGRMGYTYGSMTKRFCALGWAFTGIIVLAMANTGHIGHLAVREHAFGTAIRTLLPTGFIGLMLSAILAAQMAALSAFMVAGSALLSRNIYKRWFNPQADDAKVVKTARIAGLAMVALGVVVAFIVPGVADALTYFWAVATFSGVIIWSGLLWKRANATGAWASFFVMVTIWILVGPIGGVLHGKIAALSSIVWLGKFADKTQLHLLMVSYLPAGILTLVIGSLAGRSFDKKKLDDFYLLLRTPVGREQDLKDAGVDVVYAGASKGHPWELNHPRLVTVLGFLVALAVSVSFLGALYVLSRIGR